MDIVFQAIGIAGALLLLLAFYRNTSEKWPANSIKFQVINLMGALGIAINSYYFGAIVPCLLNVIWSLVAGMKIIRLRSHIGESSR